MIADETLSVSVVRIIDRQNSKSTLLLPIHRMIWILLTLVFRYWLILKEQKKNRTLLGGFFPKKTKDPAWLWRLLFSLALLLFVWLFIYGSNANFRCFFVTSRMQCYLQRMIWKEIVCFFQIVQIGCCLKWDWQMLLLVG